MLLYHGKCRYVRICIVVPYYTNDATLTLAGVEVYDWIGQAYTNQSQVLTIAKDTNQESTSGSTINTQYYSYADMIASTFLNNVVYQ